LLKLQLSSAADLLVPEVVLAVVVLIADMDVMEDAKEVVEDVEVYVKLVVAEL
jgi:hypothetical protein